MDHMMNTMDLFNPDNKDQFEITINWLHEWACSRNFGLGTRVPWDPKFLIESLSDSTVYMSYYTIAHKLQGLDNLDGTKTGPSGIRADQLDDGVFDFIFVKGAYPKGCTIPEATLKSLRDEFEYWYPMDLRVSGKDLIGNHLTMSVYNHCAIWDEDPSKVLERLSLSLPLCLPFLSLSLPLSLCLPCSLN
jgi:leucyl-tRNA synthetase